MGFVDRRGGCRRAAGNMKSIAVHREVVGSYITREKEAGRLLGPVPRNTLPEVHVSPFGVIPKSEEGKWRLIVDLSSPNGGSVNDGISKELCSLSYMEARVVKLGKGAEHCRQGSI